jgi:signal peptidase I
MADKDRDTSQNTARDDGVVTQPGRAPQAPATPPPHGTAAPRPRWAVLRRLWRGGSPPPGQQPDGTREIIETVVFVVVLVLLLKTFDAEAFVIPTGSMAETLYGYQKIVTCPECGIEFPVNCSQEVDPSHGPASPIYGCICPNCRKPIHFSDAPSDWVSAWKNLYPDSARVDDPGWSSGDRVLVNKWIFDLVQPPDRLDVVVFKFPGGQDFPVSGPQKDHTQMNYIKRCMGLPGETIGIRMGDVYDLPPGLSPNYEEDDKAVPRKELWQAKYMHRNDRRAGKLFEEGKFRIVRKPAEKILAMRRLVYDNDHQAKDLINLNDPRWSGKDGWEGADEHGFAHPAGEEEGVHWLHYRHLLRDNGNDPALITDFMGYNTWASGTALRIEHSHPGENWVGDLMLDAEVEVEEARGRLILELSKGEDRFQARWDLAGGRCTLVRIDGQGEEKELASASTDLEGKGTYQVRFANFDRRLTVWVDGSLPFGDGVGYEAPESLEPTRRNDLERPASVGAEGAGLKVRHLQLWRDTYYTAPEGLPNGSDVSFDPKRPESWGRTEGPPLLTLYVQPGHYLCLGDNSPESSDGRDWGAVPRRLLLGRAVMVYWPFDRFGRIR